MQVFTCIIFKKKITALQRKAVIRITKLMSIFIRKSYGGNIRPRFFLRNFYVSFLCPNNCTYFPPVLMRVNKLYLKLALRFI